MRNGTRDSMYMTAMQKPSEEPGYILGVIGVGGECTISLPWTIDHPPSHPKPKTLP